MTCTCHDPLVFGHLGCPRWETQPQPHQPFTRPRWPAQQSRTLTQSLQALTQALRAVSDHMEALQTAVNQENS